MLVLGIRRIRSGVGRNFGVLLVILTLAAEGCYVYARRIEPFWLDVTHYHLRSPRLKGLEGEIVVAVLADLQTDAIGDYEIEVFRRLDALRADLIVLPGDYIQIYGDPERLERTRQALVALFEQLDHRPRYGIWAVDGDVEDAPAVFRGSIVRPLQDEFAQLPGDPPLQILGLTVASSRRSLTQADRNRIEAFPGLTLVVGHAPDFVCEEVAAWEQYGDGALPLDRVCLAGHIHGGQVVVPGFGPPMTLSGLPRRYVTGLHRFGAMHLLVSRGVGMERGYAPRIRFNCRPELAVLHLRGPEPK